MKEKYRFNGEWEFEYGFDAFKGLQNRRGAIHQIEEESNGIIKVRIDDILNKDYDPLIEQINAIDFLAQNGKEIKNALLDKVFSEYPLLEKELIECVGIDEYRELIPKVNNPLDCAKVFGVAGVTIFPTHKDGYSYIGIQGGATWEEEHGIGFIVHKNRVIYLGSASDALTDLEARKDNGTYVKSAPKMGIYPSKEKPQQYEPHPIFGTFKPKQIEANKNYLIILICRGFHEEFIQAIDLNELRNDPEKTESYLRYAISNSNDKVIEYLLGNTDFKLNGLIHHIQSRSKISTIDLLIKFGAEINEPDKQGKTLLHKIKAQRKGKEIYKSRGFIDFETIISNIKDLENQIELRGGK